MIFILKQNAQRLNSVTVTVASRQHHRQRQSRVASPSPLLLFKILVNFRMSNSLLLTDFQNDATVTVTVTRW